MFAVAIGVVIVVAFVAATARSHVARRSSGSTHTFRLFRRFADALVVLFNLALTISIVVFVAVAVSGNRIAFVILCCIIYTGSISVAKILVDIFVELFVFAQMDFDSFFYNF